MLAAVAPFAVEAGLVAAGDPVSRIVIYNFNTGKLIEALVETPSGAVDFEGTSSIAGVPGTAAPIRLAAGSKTGSLMPTDHPRNAIDDIEMTLLTWPSSRRWPMLAASARRRRSDRRSSTSIAAFWRGSRRCAVPAGG